MELHEEVLKVLQELATSMKTNHRYQSEFRQVRNKLLVSLIPFFITEYYFLTLGH